jgi:hypothetical protein
MFAADEAGQLAGQVGLIDGGRRGRSMHPAASSEQQSASRFVEPER